MSIQYRCRCGQEVTLRSREPVYLVIGLVLGLTVLNSVLLLVVWSRLGEQSAASSAAATQAPDGMAPDANATDDDAPAAAAGRQGSQRTGFVPSRAAPQPSTSPAGSEVNPAAAARSQPLAPEATQSTDAPTADSSGAVSSGRGSSATEGVGATVVPLEPPAGAVVELGRPELLDPVILWACVRPSQRKGLDRALGWLAGATWGAGFIRESARRQLAADAEFGWLLEAANESAPGTLRLEVANVADSVRTAEPDRVVAKQLSWLRSAESRWPALWPEVLESLSPEVAVWRDGLSAPRPRDVLLLIDLSESMAADIEPIRQALSAQLPLLADAGVGQRGRRWGWISYRDEVLETAPLTADVDAFLASTASWQAEGGGDVPEGVDRAIFEALRYQSFEWDESADHVLVVIGDAPPPYERIAPMTSLVAGAHGSAEKHVCHTLGFLREEQYRTVPGFREVAEAGGGRALFLAAGEGVAEPLWGLLTGARSAPWKSRPGR